jgi:monoamine oxidase
MQNCDNLDECHSSPPITRLRINAMSQTKLNRRTLLKAMSAAPILAAAPQAVRAMNESDVIVIGAGLSGLNAALMLQGEGLNVRVLEGRNRIGGRIETLRNIPGSPEVGGTSFAPGYARLVEACRKYDVGLVDLTPIVPYFYKRELILNNEIIPADKWPTHPLNPFPQDAKQFMPWTMLNAFMAQNNPLEYADAWVDPQNAKYDVSYYDWLKQKGLNDATIQLAYNTNPTHGLSAYEVSALMMMFSGAFSGVQQQIAKSAGGAMGYTAQGGNQSIPEAMANALKNEVQLNTRVTGIRSESGQAEVHCADGTVYRAKHVVCSIPCSVLRLIKIDPMLSGNQALGVSTLESQIVNQLHLVPKAPYWEEDGLDPSMFSNSLAGMVVAEHKGAKPADISSLTIWIRGPDAAWLDAQPTEVAKQAVLDDFLRLRPAAKGKVEIVGYKSWYRDPFSIGDWAYWQPGQVSSFATELGKQQGRIHFCGEHTAISNRGMEGAMESGERVGVEVLNQI